MNGFESSDVVSLLGFYLAMVAILASIFFTRLESWYSEIQAACRLWNIADKNKIEVREEHRKKALSLQTTRPVYGFCIVSLFIILISILGYLLGIETQNLDQTVKFIFLPGAAFDFLFFMGSGILLIYGNKDINKLICEINKSLGFTSPT
jgi:hypothetical protein